MKIVILYPVFIPKWIGGTEIASFNIAKGLAENGHEVHVITSLDRGLQKHEKIHGFHIHRIPTIKKSPLLTINYAISSQFLIKRIDPDIIHCQAIHTGLAGFIANKMYKKKYVVYARGDDVYSSWLFKEVVSKLVLRNASAVIALTEDMRNKLKKFQEDILVIPNGIDIEKYINLSRGKIRESLNINDEKIIIFVGRLHHAKGIEYLIRAMQFILEKEKNVRLLIVGDGEDRGNLENLALKLNLTGKVTFVGELQNEKVPEYMVSSDVFVLPSLSEGFPMTILEAMASGLPIVASNVTGLCEIIREGENGLLVEPMNPRDFARKVLLLLEDDNLRKGISLENRKKVGDYSLSNVIKQIESIYGRAIYEH